MVWCGVVLRCAALRCVAATNVVVFRLVLVLVLVVVM